MSGSVIVVRASGIGIVIGRSGGGNLDSVGVRRDLIEDIKGQGQLNIVSI